ncbi:(2Fe-2S)-binding protein [Paenibacillus sp. LHD-117]|uniref:(2Fe-2S)-binding protein n=1 Tax=Paenibacillus sp. LHD-117 TaxID=3071412 RepID=UPI0027E1D0D3|nr:(2Fe-2S)-binding protein [Paenibacillus sp. LHD-117]MDQ6421971.1 (2Fe-2S)-binding protein [Paenibacillus sp. LHD-117]
MLSFDMPLLRDRFNIWFEADANEQTAERTTLSAGEQFDRLLKHFGAALNTSDRRVIGSLFIKRYGALIAGALYLWTHRRIGLDVSPKNVRVATNGIGLTYHILAPIEYGPLLAVQDTNRKNELYIGHLLSEGIYPVFAEIVRHTGIGESNLWATLSYTFAYWKREWIREAVSQQNRDDIESVYQVMTEHFQPEWFPRKYKNPIISRFRCVDDPLHDGQQILLRAKCCLNYRLPGEDRYCYTCPLITDERRIEKYVAAHAKEHLPITAKQTDLSGTGQNRRK